MSILNNTYTSSKEAAARLGIHQAALQKLLQSGRLPAEKIANRWLIRRGALERFAEHYEGRRGRPRKNPH